MEQAPLAQGGDAGDVRSPLVRWGYPLLGALLVGLYARTVATGPTFSDGPEIVTGIVTLGVIHPTGYPLFTLVAHAFVKLLPLDVQPCIKVSLFNALCGAGAAVFTAHVTRAFVRLLQPAPAPSTPVTTEGGEKARAGEERFGGAAARLSATVWGRLRATPLADVAGLFAGALLGTSPLVWDQIRIPEVYPFHLFLAAWALYGVMRFEVTRRAGFLVMSGLAIGLGLAHHVTMIYMLPAAIVFVAVREPSLLYAPFVWPVAKVGRLFKKDFFAKAKISRAWLFPAVAVVGFLPAFFYAYLLWANSHSVGLTWGGVKDWDGLYFHMMGKQYTKFMTWKDIGTYLIRIGRLPDAFDRQFLTVGTVLLIPGLVAGFRRAWRPSLLLVLITLGFLGHGIYYSVGDYQTYFLPAVMALAVFVGAGLDAVIRFARSRAPDKRLFFDLASVAGVFAVTSITLFAYSVTARRLPGPVERHVLAYGIPPAVIAVAFGVGAYWVRRRQKKKQEVPRLAALARIVPVFLLVCALLPTAPAVLARVSDIDDRQVIGDSYGREIMENAPPGSIVMVQGDGYLFTLWYQTHVMDRGTDAAIIDVGSLGAQWYKKYLTSHYPAPCDPLAPEFLLDRAAYDAKCKTFRQRIDLGAAAGWITTGDRRAKGITPAERTKGTGILKEWLARRSGRLPAVPLADVQCDNNDFRKTHARECRCWFDPKRDPVYNEDCVVSGEQEGLVSRERVEVWLQHLVDEHIDERPIFERNLFTHWNGNPRENVRGWNGPDYQRISGDYALVNRGRVNQILYAAEVTGNDACGEKRAIRTLVRPAPKGGPKEGRPYRPNEWPNLVTASYISRAPLDGDDYASREYATGDEIRLHIDWYEKNRYDFFAKDHVGAPIKHGVRICVFDGAGKRAVMKTTVSGKKDPMNFKLPADATPGNYHIAACTVGDVGDNAKLVDDMPCKRLILEYPFTVSPKK